MEMDTGRADTARQNFVRAGVDARVNVIVGDASRFLHKVAGPFDLIFQDGSKQLYEPLLDRLVDRLRPGGVLVTDNVLWHGEAVEGFVDPPQRDQRDTEAIRHYNDRLAARRAAAHDFPAAGRRRGAVGETAMTHFSLDSWKAWAIADAERRGLNGLTPILEGAGGRRRRGCARPRGSRPPTRPTCPSPEARRRWPVIRRCWTSSRPAIACARRR